MRPSKKHWTSSLLRGGLYIIASGDCVLEAQGLFDLPGSCSSKVMGESFHDKLGCAQDVGRDFQLPGPIKMVHFEDCQNPGPIRLP